MVDRYYSASLIERFPDKVGGFSLWTNGEPGDIAVVYRMDGQGVFGFNIGIGQNP